MSGRIETNGRFGFWSVLIGAASVTGSVIYAIVALYVSLAEMRQSLKEVETQFCASDDVRNLMHAHDLRLTALLWKKTFGTDYPIGDAYYPKICQAGRRTKP